MKKFARLMPFAVGLLPFLALAEGIPEKLTSVVDSLKTLVNAIIPLLMILIVAIFLWGIVKYVTAGGDPAKEKAARGYIIYGLIGLFVLVAMWGIVNLLASTFGITPGEGGTLPPVPSL